MTIKTRSPSEPPTCCVLSADAAHDDLSIRLLDAHCRTQTARNVRPRSVDTCSFPALETGCWLEQSYYCRGSSMGRTGGCGDAVQGRPDQSYGVRLPTRDRPAVSQTVSHVEHAIRHGLRITNVVLISAAPLTASRSPRQLSTVAQSK